MNYNPNQPPQFPVQPNTFMPPQYAPQTQPPQAPPGYPPQYPPQAPPQYAPAAPPPGYPPQAPQYAPQAPPSQAPQYAQAPQGYPPPTSYGAPPGYPPQAAPPAAAPAQYAPPGYPPQGAPGAAYGAPQSPADAMAELMAMTAGIGAASVPTDRASLPLPKNLRRIDGLPPEKNLEGEEALSYVLLQNCSHFKARDGRTNAFAKGRLLWTNGDSPLNSEVSHMAFAGDYFQKEMKQLIVAALQLTKAQASDEGFMKQCIARVYGPDQAAKDHVVAMKTFVHKAKNGNRMVRAICLPAEAVLDANRQVTGFQIKQI